MTGYFNYEMNEWTPPEGGWKYTNLHAQNWECDFHGCMIHNPDTKWVGNVENWPYFPREDGRMERLCPHGVGHSDPDSVRWHVRNGREWVGVHGCDGCCA